MFPAIVADLTPQELAAMLAKLEDVCKQAQELQRQIKARMAETARGYYVHPSPTERPERRKTPRKK